MRLAVTGGGTGGHIYPAMAVAEYAIENIPGTSVLFIGSSSGPEGGAAGAAGLPFAGLDVEGVAGKNPLKAASALLKFRRAARACRKILRDFGAECVLGTGGYASAPACSAALRLEVPLILHEMNHDPGLVTRLYGRRASRVAIAYQETAGLLPARSETVVTGVPVRPAIGRLAMEETAARLREEGMARFRLERSRATLLVFGGSQGARVLNESLWEALAEQAGRADLQVLHLVGRRDFRDERTAGSARMLAEGPLLYRPVEYLEAMELAYAVADLAVTRAGAGTLAELAVVGLPAVLVPFTHSAGGHQARNARALEKTGAVKVAPEEGGSARPGVELAFEAIGDPRVLENMREAARTSGLADGAKGIITLIEEVT